MEFIVGIISLIILIVVLSLLFSIKNALTDILFIADKFNQDRINNKNKKPIETDLNNLNNIDMDNLSKFINKK